MHDELVMESDCILKALDHKLAKRCTAMGLLYLWLNLVFARIWFILCRPSAILFSLAVVSTLTQQLINNNSYAQN